MQSIELKEFQINTVNKLLDATSIGIKKEVLVQAPTGSGKTIILLSYIEEYIKENKNTIFVWLTPGSGDLKEQSRNKMIKYLPNLESKSLQDILSRGFESKDTAFINWETITKKGNTALKEAEIKNLYERIKEASNNGFEFIVLVDEEDYNKTVKAEAIIDFINPKYIIRVSATPKINKEAEYIKIDELDVINAGLITRALYINENVTNNQVLTNEHEYLLDLAINKRKAIKNEYIKRNIHVNPLIIIQVPNKSDELIKQIEILLEEKGFSYEKQNLAIWLTGTDNKKNIDDLEENESHQAILIMKQAISRGWDCPRAKILVKLRDNMSEDFETQVLGRIRRMPQAHHYENTLLDNCYLYTFDEKYEQSVKKELGENAKNSKVIFLKPEFKNISLKKLSIESDFDGFDDRETFNIIYKYYVEKYKLTSSMKNNKSTLEANGYIFKNTIDNYIIKGKFIRLEEIPDGERIKIDSTVNPSKNGYEYRDSISEISSRIGIRYDRTKLILERLFLKSKLFSKKFVDLSLLNFYAFIINNHAVIKHDFEEAVNQKARQMKLKLKEVKETNWKMPQEDYINYDSKMRDTIIYEKNVYKDYPNSRVKSRPESMFEFYCEKSDNIKWFYKNGESADIYFSIVYVNAVGKKFHFYPDYLICDKNDKVWIIETKGGESSSGESKNIDIKVENKFEALKEYSKNYKVNWAFIRDYDKNNNLYYCNTEYTDNMENDNWQLLDKMFD